MSGEPGQSTPLHGAEQGADRLNVAFVTRSQRWAESGIALGDLSQAAIRAYEKLGGAQAGEVAIVLADDAQIRELNREFAGRDKATDVLSFPSGDEADEGEPVPLGDIILAFETVQRDAREAGLMLSAHASHLVIHGLLHLLGYDHSTESEAAAMEGLETEIMAGLGLHDPYGLPAETHA